jgi:hypothetical protein
MRAAGGQPCPMHRAADGTGATRDCAIRGACERLSVIEFALLFHNGVIGERTTAPLAAACVRIVDSLGDGLIANPSAPDAPPPRV